MAGFENTIVFSSGEKLSPSSSDDISRMQENSTDVSRVNYTGDPNSNVSANPGSLCHDPVSGNLYYKQTGTGDTGWILLGPAQITLTADDTNSLTGTAFDLFGQAANTVPTMQSLINSGKFLFVNNAWDTQYVIDASSTVGLKGTFQTIQAALNQAVSDGMTYTNPKKFIIRPGTYTQNLTIPGGAYFEGMGYSSDPTALPQSVTIVGNHTMAAIGLWSSRGINWQCASGVLFTAGATFAIIQATDTSFYNSGTGLLFDFSTATTVLDWYDVTLTTGILTFATAIRIITLSANSIRNCKFNGVGLETRSGVLRMECCKDVGELFLNAVSASAFIRDTNFVADLNDNIYGTGAATLINCGFNNNDGSKYAFSATHGTLMINCYLWTNASVPADLTSPTVPVTPGFGQAGNILKGHRYDGAGTYTLDPTGDSYVGVTGTQSDTEVHLKRGPHSSSTTMTDYQVWVVDEAGTAATNAILVSDAEGALINGNATYSIDENFGAALFHTNGVDWFVIASNKTGGGGGSVAGSNGFSAYLSLSQSNVTGDGTLINPILFDTTVYNDGSNYNTSTGVYTAPVAGNYIFNTTYFLNGLTSSHTVCEGRLVCSTFGSIANLFGNLGAERDNNGNFVITATQQVKLALGETVNLSLAIYNGAKVVTLIGGAAGCVLGGYRIS